MVRMIGYTDVKVMEVRDGKTTLEVTVDEREYIVTVDVTSDTIVGGGPSLSRTDRTLLSNGIIRAIKEGREPQ